jgi:hypothetical protein
MTSGLPDYYTVPRPHGRTWNPYDLFTVDDAIAASLVADGRRSRWFAARNAVMERGCGLRYI